MGGDGSSEGSAGDAGEILTSNGAAAAPSWKSLSLISGLISNVYYVQGTTALNIPQGTTADVPGVTITLTVPAGMSQTFLFTILGYGTQGYTGTNTGSQGVFSLLQNGTKISSVYASSSSTPNLVNMPSPVTFMKSVTLSAGTYTFKVQYSSWFANQIVNWIPSPFAGYNNDKESMLTRMQVLVYNN